MFWVFFFGPEAFGILEGKVLIMGLPGKSLWQRLTRCLGISFPLPEHTRIMHFSISLEIRLKEREPWLTSGLL